MGDLWLDSKSSEIKTECSVLYFACNSAQAPARVAVNRVKSDLQLRLNQVLLPRRTQLPHIAHLAINGHKYPVRTQTSTGQ